MSEPLDPGHMLRPSPTGCNIQQVRGPDGKDWILMTFTQVHGMFSVFITPDAAKGIAKVLEEHAVQASTGLILPPQKGLHSV